MSINADLLFGKRFEWAAAHLYAQETWPGSVVAACPAYADVDFVATSEEKGLLALIEVKTRRCDSQKYASTIVSMRKHHVGRYAKEYLKVLTPCVVVFTDTVAVFNLHLAPDSTEMITRWDRTGVGVEHACYLHSKLTWLPELHAKILAEVAREQGLE